MLGVVGAFRHLRRVRLARSRTKYEIPADEVARIDRANTRGARRGAGARRAGDMSARRRRSRPDHVGHARCRPAPAANRQRTGVEAHRRRLRLLDLPALRLHHVLRVLRRLCGARRGNGGRPGRRASSSISTPSRSRPRACCSPASPAAWRASLPGVAQRRSGSTSRMAVTVLLGRRFSRSKSRSSAAWSPRGAGPTRSAFLSAFFTLVGCHGLHVTVGLLWLGTMMAQVFTKGFRPTSCAGIFASRCSGTRSTSFGWRSSRSSIWWELSR